MILTIGDTEMVTHKERTLDHLLLLWMIKEYNSVPNHIPLDMPRLQSIVYLTQQVGVPFSYNDWDMRDFMTDVKNIMGWKGYGKNKDKEI